MVIFVGREEGRAADWNVREIGMSDGLATYRVVCNDWKIISMMYVTITFSAHLLRFKSRRCKCDGSASIPFVLPLNHKNSDKNSHLPLILSSPSSSHPHSHLQQH
jgi:hypothetical protein